MDELFREEYAIVLDFLPMGYASSYKKEAIAQALGEKYFTLLELSVKPGVKLSLRDRVYIGKEKRDKIQYIKGKLDFSRLTATARNELRDVVNEMVEQREKEFVDFFNKAGPITIRQHSLELLPGVGKKHMFDILDEREKKNFESFKEISERINLMPDPKRVIVDRILEELQGNCKYYLFVKNPKIKRP